MKKDTDPASLLADLRASLERIKTLLAWQDLKRSEAGPGEAPSFVIYDPMEMDLRNEYSFFLARSVELRSRLAKETIDRGSQQDTLVAIELKKLERQLDTLGLSAGMDWYTRPVSQRLWDGSIS